MSYNPTEHPRAPKGTPQGGQFTNKPGVGVDNDLTENESTERKYYAYILDFDGAPDKAVDITEERKQFLASCSPEFRDFLNDEQEYNIDQLRIMRYGFDQGYDMSPVNHPEQFEFYDMCLYVLACQDGRRPERIAKVLQAVGPNVSPREAIYLADTNGERFLLQACQEAPDDKNNANYAFFLWAAELAGTDVDRYMRWKRPIRKIMEKVDKREWRQYTHRRIPAPKASLLCKAMKRESCSIGWTVMTTYDRIVTARNSRFSTVHPTAADKAVEF